MNKELIKKYEQEFKWWVDGGLILWMDSTGIWDNDDSVWENCNYSDAKVIIDDAYSKFRRALAEGKSLEVFNANYYKQLQTNTWVNMDTLHLNTTIPVEHYRIKPNDPKFQVGDWVRDNANNKIVQVTKHMIEYGLIVPEGCEFWQPQVGEWVIPKMPTTESFSVFKYFKEYRGFELEPFIGTLPTSIKD